MCHLQGRLCIYEIMAEESTVNYWEVSIRNWLERTTGFMMALLFCFVEIWQYRFRCSTKSCPYLLFDSAPKETNGNVLLFLFYCPAGQVQYVSGSLRISLILTLSSSPRICTNHAIDR